jgi:hypothetical protein
MTVRLSDGIQAQVAKTQFFFISAVSLSIGTHYLPSKVSFAEAFSFPVRNNRFAMM